MNQERTLFEHLPDEVVDELCNSESPSPIYRKVAGHVLLVVRGEVYGGELYVLRDGHVLCLRICPDDTKEMVTYRDKRLLKRLF